MIISVSMSSCNTYKQTPLSAALKPNPISIVNVKGLTRDQVWDRVVRLFADRNISIKTIDKSSGFIQSDMLSFISAYQIDSEETQTHHPIYVITQREQAYGVVIQPSYITGYLKVFILNDSGKVEVHASIEDLRNYHIADIHHRHSNVISHDEIKRQVISTGNLESKIANFVSANNDSTDGISVQNGEILNPQSNYSEYLKKKQRITFGALIGGEIGGVGILTTILLLAIKR